MTKASAKTVPTPAHPFFGTRHAEKKVMLETPLKLISAQDKSMFKSFKKLFITVADMADQDNLLRIINALQNNIESSLATLTSNIQNDSTLLTSVTLKAGQVNRVDHKLGRKLAGWKIVRQRSAASVFDNQDGNTSPHLTLWLTTSADVEVDLEVF